MEEVVGDNSESLKFEFINVQRILGLPTELRFYPPSKSILSESFSSSCKYSVFLFHLLNEIMGDYLLIKEGLVC